MEKRIIWFQLLLKLSLKKKILWFQMIAMIFLVWLISNVTLPDTTNTRVLLYNEDGDFGQQFIDSLKQEDSVFSFEQIDNSEELKRLVLQGKAECGLILKKGLEENLIQEKPKKLIQFVSSNSSTKDSLVRETVYRKLFSYYSEILLEHRMGDIFRENVREKAWSYIKDRVEYYRESTELFDVTYETIETIEGQQLPEKKANPVHGVVAIVLLLNMLLIRGEDISGGSDYEKTLGKWEKREFVFWKYFMGTLLLAAEGIVLYLILGVAQNIFVELGKMLLFLAYSAVWVSIIGGFLKRKTTYFAWICPLVIVNLLLPPVFINVSAYLPGLNGLNWLLPVGIYLKI